MLPHYDVAIIGAGPAGTTCALALRDADLDVLLIDKDRFPRDKICGDAIPGPAFRVLDELDHELGQRMYAFGDRTRVATSRAVGPSGHSITMDWKTFSYNSKRLDFDDFLLGLVRERTRTHIEEGAQLRGLDYSPEGITGRLRDGRSFTTRLVIGCDGANSTVARQLAGDDLKGNDRGVAVRAYYRGVAGTEPGVNEFYFLRDMPFGYFWLFPLDDGWVNVGLGALEEVTGADGKPVNLRERLDDLLQHHPQLAPRFRAAEAMDKTRGFVLPFCHHPRPLVGERYLLCGDAAYLVSPLWGHGIDTAMRSGLEAGRQAIRSLATNKLGARDLHPYREVIEKRIARPFRQSHYWLRAGQRFPFLVGLLWRSLRYEGAIKWLVRTFRLL
jgi:geranylgeranyl reductase family protein